MPATINQKEHKQAQNGTVMSDRKQRIYSFLHDTQVGVLSSVTPDGNPHAAVIYFSISKHFVITFLTKSATRKYDNLIHNDHAALTVFDSKTQTIASITGTATEITDSYDINAIAGENFQTSMKTSEAGMPPIAKLEAGQYAAFKLEPSQIRMAVYGRPDPGDYSELFETIESFDFAK